MDANTFRNTADDFTKAYVECALWSSSADVGKCDDCGHLGVTSTNDTCSECGSKNVHGMDLSFIDRQMDIENIAPATLDSMVVDCARFQTANSHLITEENSIRYGPDCYSASDRAGHDFWLTRNGHGAGFWDGDWADAASKQFGDVDLYIGDDGLIYAYNYGR